MVPGRKWLLALCCAAACLFGGGAATLQAALQFDVFLGYDGIVPEACWFPVVCEIKNDGPSFNGTVEVSSGAFKDGQTRLAVVELPTGTLKRIVIPVFSTSRGFSTWDVRLMDERGRTRAEQTGLRANKQTASRTPVVGALARTAGGVPALLKIKSQQSDLQPVAARMLPAIFPDNPIVLEGMQAIYLNSEVASELKVNQVNALLAWLDAGGHLIVAVEQPSDISAARWLKDIFPCDVTDVRPLPRHTEIQQWLKSTVVPPDADEALSNPNQYYYGGNQNRSRNTTSIAGLQPFSDLADDFAFETSPLQVATGKVREGQVVLAVDQTPLIVEANRGRGRVTALLFSPEREPMRTWKNLPTFWTRVVDAPLAWYVLADNNNQMGGASSDGIFGALIDTRQVHKLPVEWLLLLLVVYLVVIGPLDQFWLKRIGRPMLTWITFPCYVVLFSLLIYFIGYKLRAGESEWNELHLVDAVLKSDHAELRGRTYASVYSPSNERYALNNQEKYATLRGELANLWGAGGQSGERATVIQNGDSFKAEIFVPVWTSQLFVSDWWNNGTIPFDVEVTPAGEGWQVKVQNRTGQKVSTAQLAVEDSILTLGELGPRETKTFTVSRTRGSLLKDFVHRFGQSFATAAHQRQGAFGASEAGRLEDLPNSTMAVSFLSRLSGTDNYMGRFIAPPGLDLWQAVQHGNAVFLAWEEDFSPIKQMHQFSPKRSHKNTLWRVTVPVVRRET
jgi:hypothetical protein